MSFNSPAEKRRYVNDMFARIAHRYDMMNRVMTGGQDQQWRKILIQQAQLPPRGKMLDIATGTGDIAFEALRQQPELSQVVGADFTLPMLREAQNRGRAKAKKITAEPGSSLRFSWSGADTLHLPFPDNTFDAVASGFLLRNVTNVAAALSEQRRVCKLEGRVLVLEIPRPADSWRGRLFRFYFHRIVPILGSFISGQRDAYTYLPASADVFLRPDELKAEMGQVGLKQVTYKMLMFQTVALHVGIK